MGSDLKIDHTFQFSSDTQEVHSCGYSLFSCWKHHARFATFTRAKLVALNPPVIGLICLSHLIFTSSNAGNMQLSHGEKRVFPYSIPIYWRFTWPFWVMLKLLRTSCNFSTYSLWGIFVALRPWLTRKERLSCRLILKGVLFFSFTGQHWRQNTQPEREFL